MILLLPLLPLLPWPPPPPPSSSLFLLLFLFFYFHFFSSLLVKVMVVAISLLETLPLRMATTSISAHRRIRRIYISI